MHKLYYALADKRFLAQENLLGLLELAQSRGVHPDKLLKGSSLFSGDIEDASTMLSAQQLLTIYKNAKRSFGADDSSFLLGQYLLPGNHPQFASAILASPTLLDLIELLQEFGFLSQPLIEFKSVYDDQNLYLQLLPVDIDDYANDFLMESISSAFFSFSRWLGVDTSSWSCLHAFKEPKYQEQFLVHYGLRPKFASHINAIIIPRASLSEQLPRGSRARFDLACKLCKQNLAEKSSRSLSLWVYQSLQDELSQAPGLEELAERLELSPASFKRYLKAEGCSYQAILDSVRRHMAIYYLHTGQLSTEEIAQKLNYHDKHNFKRSFRRWTGINPSIYLASS